MREYIIETLKNFYATCSVDRYGQVNTTSVSCIFKDKTEEVEEYIKKDKTLIKFTTYGGSCGTTYKGFNIYDFICEDLRKECYQQLNKNKNYIWAMTH